MDEWTVAGVENDTTLEFKRVGDKPMMGIVWEVHEALDDVSGDYLMCLVDPDHIKPNQYFWSHDRASWARMF